MNRSFRAGWLTPLLAFLAASACQSDLTAPTAPDAAAPNAAVSSAGDDPTFLDAAAGAPTIANPVVSFYAVKGEDHTAFMYYHAAPGDRDSVDFVRFRVRARSLESLPDGTPIADGDSVLITLTLSDAAHLVVDFQPAGMRFSSDHPADLRLSYLEADNDFNDDGAVNGKDTSIARQFQIWKSETVSDPWAPLPSAVLINDHEVEADIFGFTRYAIAY